MLRYIVRVHIKLLRCACIKTESQLSLARPFHNHLTLDLLHTMTHTWDARDEDCLFCLHSGDWGLLRNWSSSQSKNSFDFLQFLTLEIETECFEMYESFCRLRFVHWNAVKI